MIGLMAAVAAVTVQVPAQEPAKPGTIAIEAPAGDLPPEVGQVFTDAVRNALAGVEFTPLPPPGRGRYLARLTVTRTQRGMVASRVPRSRADAAMGNWGGAIFVPLKSRNTRMTPLVVTELRVRILRRVGGAEVWSARALTAQAEGTDDDEPAVVAGKLADAIAGVFPQQSSEPISVP